MDEEVDAERLGPGCPFSYPKGLLLHPFPTASPSPVQPLRLAKTLTRSPHNGGMRTV